MVSVWEKVAGSVAGQIDLGGLDPRKMIDLIDELWDSRKKIVSAVDFVWDNREPIAAAVAFMQEHADDLIELGRRLPSLLATAGKALDQAGDGARKASAMLLGSGGSGVAELAADAADALERCQAELWNVMGLLDDAGSGLAALPVVGEVAQPIVAGAGKIGLVAGDLGAVASRLRGLGESIDDAGRSLRVVGSALTSSGGSLQRLAPPTATARRAATTATRARSTRPAAKRRTSGRPQRP